MIATQTPAQDTCELTILSDEHRELIEALSSGELGILERERVEDDLARNEERAAELRGDEG